MSVLVDTGDGGKGMVRDAMVAKELAALGETVVREAFKNQFRTVSRVMPSIWPMVL